jgi:hypothetical protein
MKSVLIVAEMLCTISICWGQSGKPPARIEAEYYVTAYAQHYCRAFAEEDRGFPRTDFPEARFLLADKWDLYSIVRIGSRTTASVGHLHGLGVNSTS